MHYTANTVQETPVTIPVLANDLLGSEPTAITEVSDPRSGTVTYDAQTGTITYLPDTDFTGLDSFTYKITDSSGKTSSATVSIEVSPADSQGSPLLASTAPLEPVGAEEALTEEALQPIIAEAKQCWIVSGSLNHRAIKLLDAVTFRIADLNGLTLGLTMDDTVLIDANAAGHGWFVDETPSDDTEFDLPSPDGELLAATGAIDVFLLIS